MAIEIEGRENLIYCVPGIYQEDLTRLFHQVLFCLTNDAVVVYNDQLPDGSNVGNYVYKIHAKLQYSDIVIVLFEDLSAKKGFLYKKRVHFVAEDQKKSLVFYLKKEEFKYLKKLEKELKARKIKTEHRKVKIDL